MSLGILLASLAPPVRLLSLPFRETSACLFLTLYCALFLLCFQGSIVLALDVDKFLYEKGFIVL